MRKSEQFENHSGQSPSIAWWINYHTGEEGNPSSVTIRAKAHTDQNQDSCCNVTNRDSFFLIMLCQHCAHVLLAPIMLKIMPDPK